MLGQNTYVFDTRKGKERNQKLKCLGEGKKKNEFR
jgi:hypothetical protein